MDEDNFNPGDEVEDDDEEMENGWDQPPDEPETEAVGAPPTNGSGEAAAHVERRAEAMARKAKWQEKKDELVARNAAAVARNRAQQTRALGELERRSREAAPDEQPRAVVPFEPQRYMAPHPWSQVHASHVLRIAANMWLFCIRCASYSAQRLTQRMATQCSQRLPTSRGSLSRLQHLRLGCHPEVPLPADIAVSSSRARETRDKAVRAAQATTTAGRIRREAGDPHAKRLR